MAWSGFMCLLHRVYPIAVHLGQPRRLCAHCPCRHSGLPQGFRRSYAAPQGGLRPLPLVESFGEFRSVALPMLLALGPLLHTDPVLMVKVVRLGRAYLLQRGAAAGGELRFDLLTLLATTLLPSLSLLDCNCCVADELWSLVKLYPYQER